MALTLMERCFPRRLTDMDAVAPFCLMGLDALVYLDVAPYVDQVKEIWGCESVVQLESPQQFAPATLFLRSGQKLIVAYEGTRGIDAWWNYVQGAGVSAIGPAPGACFAPFATITRSIQPGTISQWRNGDLVLFTGHSLGAAVCSMMTSLQTQAGWNTRLAYAFACPRYCDESFAALASGAITTFALPGDPVPYLPPDVVNFIERDPSGIRWTQLFTRIGGEVSLPPWSASVRVATALDWWVQLAASNINFRFSPHQTYQYLRSLSKALPGGQPADVVAWERLLVNAGLLDPWPA